MIQVQFYQELEWVVADDTVNENNPRTINSGGVLALDTIFNGNVNSGDLIKDFGAGSYRVYACFRDPDGTVLVCDNDSLMEDSYQFTVSDS